MANNIVVKRLIGLLLVYYVYMILVDVVIPKKSFWGMLLNISVFAFFLYYSVINNRYALKFGYLFIYSFFVLILIILQSSDFLISIRTWILMTCGMAALPIGYEFFVEKTAKEMYWKYCVITFVLFLANAIIANVFHLGGGYSKHNETYYETGNLFAAALYTNVYIFTIMPLFIKDGYNVKKYHVFLCMICLVLTIVNMKRTPIACLIVSSIILLVGNFKFRIGMSQNNYLGRNNLHKYLFLSVFVFSVGLFMFSDLISKQIEIRNSRFESGSLQKEGRYREVMVVYDETVKSDDLLTFLFGKETFNTVGNYGGGSFKKRGIHEDFALVLHGTGVVGCIFLYSIQLSLFIVVLIRIKRLKMSRDNTKRLTFVTLFAILSVHYIAMLSGELWALYSSIIFYLNYGMLLRRIDFWVENNG